MLRIMIFIIVLLFSTQCFALTMNKDQFQYIEYIHDVLKNKYPQFKGFAGPAKNIKVFGLAESTVKEEMEKINFDELKTIDFERNDEIKKVRSEIVDSAITKLEQSGTVFKHKEYIKNKILKKMEVSNGMVQ